ncbi:hypothetical protein ACMD2_17976 [Ananas comosus]|uniref:Uncharacterized protein n=1 Tax=Ananas comosus TaxID=4615 RepID=A0A199UG06_ANACO|nr:hypothetical protein ACMD2_17976 [Ananas comosus]
MRQIRLYMHAEGKGCFPLSVKRPNKVIQGQKGKCNRKLESHHVAHIDRYRRYFDKIVDLLPVVAAVGVDKSWYKYNGGVFQGYPTEKSNLNHEGVDPQEGDYLIGGRRIHETT